MTQAILATWPVPEGHSPVPARKMQEATKEYLSLQALVELGHVEPGTQLVGAWGGAPRARVLADGRLEVDGKIHASPSGAAGAALGGGSVNGWQFWRTEDGRELRDLRP